MPDTPQLVARFATDEQGEPQYVETSTGRKHYRIVIEVENVPSDLVAATFALDPTYYMPLRTVEPGVDGRVKLETTAYGDYALNVDLRSKSGVIPIKTTLRKALLSGESREREPKIGAAIAEIAAR
jgi:hypothetical protein